MREVLTQTLGALLGVLGAAAVIVVMAIVVTTVASSNALGSFSRPELDTDTNRSLLWKSVGQEGLNS